MDRLKDKIAVITGAAKGIGYETVRTFINEGAQVVMTDLDVEAGSAASAHFGTSCNFIAQDVTDESSWDKLANHIETTYGRLDVLVNNAGISWVEPLDEFSEAGWDAVINTNMKGVFFLTQKLLPLLRNSANAENPARVVNIGSIDGITTPYYEAFPYGPSKAAVHHLTRILAARLVREHILVNAIAPGPFPSRMLSSGIGAGPDPSVVDWETTGEILPRGRVGSVEDIAGLAIYLCSRAGAYTVGETITCDGGVMIVGSNNK